MDSWIRDLTRKEQDELTAPYCGTKYRLGNTILVAVLMTLDANKPWCKQTEADKYRAQSWRRALCRNFLAVCAQVHDWDEFLKQEEDSMRKAFIHIRIVNRKKCRSGH